MSEQPGVMPPENNQDQPTQWQAPPAPGQQAGQPDQPWAPSAYSAPAPAGYPMPGQAQQAPMRKPSAFSGIFSTNFAAKHGTAIARLIMIFLYVAMGLDIFAKVLGLFTFSNLNPFALFSSLLGIVITVFTYFVALGITRMLGELCATNQRM